MDISHDPKMELSTDNFIDLRSDTVTHPTEKMRDAMRDALVGDDVIGDDPTVRELEKLGAKIFGKEACLFTGSGTMSNQVAVLSMVDAGSQIILHDKSHMYNLEVGALGRICGVSPRPVSAPEGVFPLQTLEANIFNSSIQTAPTKLICMENTFDLNQGLVVGKKHIDDVCDLGHEHGIFVYMDGARILNASVALKLSPAKMCEKLDAVSVCLSKALACPVGSLLIGSKKMIKRAREMRQMLGGGWRQAGILAAVGLVVLNDYNRLEEDHHKAKILAEALQELGLGIRMKQVQTNIIKIDVSTVGTTAVKFCECLEKHGVKAKPIEENAVRMITHIDFPLERMESVVNAVKSTLSELKR